MDRHAELCTQDANTCKRARTRQNGSKTNNSPVETASQCSDEPNGCRDQTDVSSVWTDAHSIETQARMAANTPERIRMCRNGSKTRNSPHMCETTTPEPTYQRKRVSTGDRDTYIPSNTPVEAVGTANRMFAFGQVESAGEGMTGNAVDETAGDGDGNRNGGDGDVHGTTSSGHIHLKRVKKALLAIDSQLKRQSQRTRNNDLPVSSIPPIQPAERPYEPARWQR